MKRSAGEAAPAVRGRFAAAMIVLERRLIDCGPAARSRVVRRVHVAVLRVGGRAERFGLGKISDHRVRTALCDAARLLLVADQRGHVVSAAHERVEHGGADVAGRASQEDSHRGRIS